jgi:hypothetical protein
MGLGTVVVVGVAAVVGGVFDGDVDASIAV